MEDVRIQGLVHVAALLTDSVFCLKGRVILLVNGSELVKRLVACGYTASSAEDICQRYAAAGNFSGLETFIKQIELLYDDRKEYA
jgi:hypothetical protein